MAIATQQDSLTAEYRYFVHDLVTNDFLVEVPFKGVSYGRSLKEAGSFQGDIPVIDATYNLDLYNNTLPGKHAIYVTRDGVCVWGGIIWSRNYNIKDKVLSVQASEFTSYLFHRTAWRTWSNQYQATVTISGGGGTVELDTGSYGFSAGMPVYISFGLDSNRKYDGYYTVLGSPAPTTNTFSFSKSSLTNLAISDRVDSTCTVTVRQDTYEYVRDLITAMGTDFFDFDFPNSEIEPAAEFFQTIVSASRSGGIATVTLDAAHGLIVGQRVKLTDLDISTGFNGRFLTTAVTDTTFSYESTGPDIAETAVSPNTKTVLYAERSTGGTVTLTTDTAHGFAVGNLVTVYDVNGSIDGLHSITSIPSTNTFQFNTYYTSEIVFSPVNAVGANPVAVVSASVKFSTYGEFSNNADLGFSYSTTALSPQDPRVNPIFRGGDLKYVGEILDSYSNVQNGFEYRVDCIYDEGLDTFRKVFTFLPLVPESLQTYLTGLINYKGTTEGYYTLPIDNNNVVNDAYLTISTGLLYVWNGVAWVYTGGIGILPTGETAPPAAYGADALVFEHPGNILDVTMEETAEDSATRFWVQGVDDTGNADASLPYAAEVAPDYLAAGWPLLDQVEKVDDVSDEDTLYIHARQFLKEAKPPVSYFSIAINGSTIPEVGTFAPGDWCSVIIDDDFVRLRLQSPLEPNSGNILIRKIEAYSVQVPDAPSLPEQVDLQLTSSGLTESIGGRRMTDDVIASLGIENPYGNT